MFLAFDELSNQDHSVNRLRHSSVWHCTLSIVIVISVGHRHASSPMYVPPPSEGPTGRLWESGRVLCCIIILQRKMLWDLHQPQEAAGKGSRHNESPGELWI